MIFIVFYYLYKCLFTFNEKKVSDIIAIYPVFFLLKMLLLRFNCYKLVTLTIGTKLLNVFSLALFH